MGKRGPQKKPDAIKRMEGNPGQYPLNDNAPSVGGLPTRPEHISEYACVVWDRIINSMPPKLYGACDSELLTAYCVAAGMHKEAVEELTKGDGVVKGKNDAPYQNPWVGILNKQAQLIATLGGRLGLDPAARSSINMPKGQSKSTKFGDLIGIKGGQTE